MWTTIRRLPWYAFLMIAGQARRRPQKRPHSQHQVELLLALKVATCREVQEGVQHALWVETQCKPKWEVAEWAQAGRWI